MLQSIRALTPPAAQEAPVATDQLNRKVGLLEAPNLTFGVGQGLDEQVSVLYYPF